MLQLQRVDSGLQGGAVVLKKYPSMIGQSPECDARIQGPGVWDRHAGFEIANDLKVVVTPVGQALLLVNHAPVSLAVLKSGDLLQIGSCSFRVSLSPPRQTALWKYESAVWLMAVAMIALQVLLVCLIR